MEGLRANPDKVHATVSQIGFWPNFRMNVAGVTFEDRQETIRQLIDGNLKKPETASPDYIDLPHELEVRFDLEPNNQHDPNAVRIMIVREGVADTHVGYVARRRCPTCLTNFRKMADFAQLRECDSCGARLDDTPVTHVISHVNVMLAWMNHWKWIQQAAVFWIGTTAVGGSLGIGIAALIGPNDFAIHWAEFWRLYTAKEFADRAGGSWGDHSTGEYERRLMVVKSRLEAMEDPFDAYATSRAVSGPATAGA